MDNQTPINRKPQARVSEAGGHALAIGLLFALVGSAFPAAHPAQAENGVMSAGSALQGRYHHLRFILPFRGDFSRYNKVEIVRPTSDIGPDRVPPEKMQQYTQWLHQMFASTGLFEEVQDVEEMRLDSPLAVAAQTGTLLPSDPSAFPAADEEIPAPRRISPILLASLSPDGEPVGISAADASALGPPPASTGEQHTLVVTSTVLDYVKGNRGLRLLGVGLGGARFTARFSLYDKQTGQEVARGNVTGVVEDGSFGLPGGSSSDQSLKVAADDLVGHVENRVRDASR